MSVGAAEIDTSFAFDRKASLHMQLLCLHGQGGLKGLGLRVLGSRV